MSTRTSHTLLTTIDDGPLPLALLHHARRKSTAAQRSAAQKNTVRQP